MNIYEIVFYFLYAFCAISALAILFTKNVLYAAYALIACLVCLAGIYVLAGAEFMGVVQLVIYAGGILILLIFGIMMTSRISGDKVITPTYHRIRSAIVSIGFFALFYHLLYAGEVEKISWIKRAQDKGVEQALQMESLGITLLTDYGLIFEIAGVLLLLAMIGAALIASYAMKKTRI